MRSFQVQDTGSIPVGCSNNMNKDFQIGSLVIYPNPRYQEALDKLNSFKELDETMNQENINSQASAEAAVKTNQFIIGSVDYSGNVSFAANPTLHYSAGLARQECKRLATKNPGKTFVFVQLRGAERTVVQPSVISI